jgi:BirA family biotin operon repressor/biotin-[acetyl-CoA-carboxylase] ligase
MKDTGLGRVDYDRALAAAGLAQVEVFHRKTTGSTNDDARALEASKGRDPRAGVALVIAESQTQGRGRGANTWSSPKGSIAMTLMACGVDASRLSVLPLGVGAAVVASLRALGVPAVVKWPNDVLIDGRKVCGILCESSVLEGAARVFIGIGVNVEAATFEPEVATRATTLADHGLIVDRPALVADIARRVLEAIRDQRPGAYIVEEWKAASVPWWGEAVTLIEGEGAGREVTLLDVNPQGLLVVRDDLGVVRSLVSGEIRGLRKATA